MNKEELSKTFTEYVEKYDMTNPHVDLKYHHSFRVMDLCNKIAKSLNLDENDIEIANLVGLLHDYGRFFQVSEYNTYDDFKSIDHGDMGVKFLFEDEEILNFTNKIKNFDEIYDGIKYHNKYEIPKMSDHNTLITNIVRDADKLDILYLATIDVVKMNESEKEITEEVKEQFYNHKSIDMRYLKSKNDKIIVFLGFVFDLNYEYSFKYLVENKVFDILFEKLENKERFAPYFEEVKKYIGGKYAREEV